MFFMNYTSFDDFPLLQTTGYVGASPRNNNETKIFETFTPLLGINHAEASGH